MIIFNEYGVLIDADLIKKEEEFHKKAERIFKLARIKGANPVELRALCHIMFCKIF